MLEAERHEDEGGGGQVHQLDTMCMNVGVEGLDTMQRVTSIHTRYYRNHIMCPSQIDFVV